MHNTGFLRNATQIKKKKKKDDTTFGYMMEAQEHEAMMTKAQKDSENPVEIEDLELVETPSMMPTEDHDKKQPGLINPIQAAEFVHKTNISLNKFVNTIHSYEPYGHHTAYETLMEEYYDELVQIEDYFRDADKDLVVALIDDKTCKMVRVETAKAKKDRETFADSHISTPNLLSRPAALTHLAALPNFKNIDAESRERVCDLFDSLLMAHSTIADVAQNVAALGRQLDPDQFGIILKHSVRPLVQLQIPPGLCNPADLKFAKSNLTPEEQYNERGVNTIAKCLFLGMIVRTFYRFPCSWVIR